MSGIDPQADHLLRFWFSEPMCNHWFKSTPQIDEEIRAGFETLWQQAVDGELDHWQQAAESCLALIILLDQLPLNMFRNQAKSFSSEGQAIDACLYGLEQGYDRQLAEDHLAFFYMPLMHSESLEHQTLSVRCFERAGLQGNLRFAQHHRDLIAEFGRFPHRNALLGRESTPAELTYLDSKRAFKG